MDEMSITTTPRRRRIFVVLAAVAAAGAAAVAVAVWLQPDQHHRPAPVAAATPPLLAAPPETPTPTPTPTPSSAPRHSVPHDFVAKAVPYRFTLAGKGFTIRAHVCSMPPVFPLDPPGEQHHTVCWVTKGFGYQPGSTSRTSYILGHSWAEDPLEVLNRASERATRDILHAKVRRLDGVPIFPAPSLVGSRITLHTPRGILGYTVRSAFGVNKYKLGDIHSIMDPDVRNRVVLITCAELNGVDYNYNVVLDARLTSSRRSS